MADKNEGPSLPLKILQFIAVIVAALVYGFFANVNGWFPAKTIRSVQASFIAVFESFERPWHTSLPGQPKQVELIDETKLAEGLLLMAGISSENRIFARVVDRAGTIHHEWNMSFFDIWGDDTAGFAPEALPAREPGTMIHGINLRDNGDVIFNFEFLSTVRLDACANIVWKSKNFAHHFIFDNRDETLWVGSLNFSDERLNHKPPYHNWSIQKISVDGEILDNINILDILMRNRLYGLMAMSTLHNTETTVGGNTLHLNDVDVFPEDMTPGIFAPGDMAISLRNINTVLVIDPEDLRVKFLSVGEVLRQHDADFLDGNRLIVYDNNNVDPLDDPNFKSTRIALIDARTGAVSTYYEGEGKAQFYSPTMGQQEILPNGNLLILSPHEGRAMEVSPQGELLWQYFNRFDDEYSGLLSEVHLLPQYMDKAFFERARATCG